MKKAGLAKFYRGQVVSQFNSFVWGSNKPKDTYYRVRNKDKGEPSVLSYVYSNWVIKDRRFYAPCSNVYRNYKEYCNENKLTPLSSWQFKRNMQILGFVWSRCHGFYAGYGKQRVTTAFKNIALNPIH